MDMYQLLFPEKFYYMVGRDGYPMWRNVKKKQLKIKYIYNLFLNNIEKYKFIAVRLIFLYKNKAKTKISAVQVRFN